MPRPLGAIQPFSVPDILLPEDAMFQRFCAQLLASGELRKPTSAEPIEGTAHEYLEEITLSPINSEPMFSPEQAIAGLNTEADLAMRELPIQPFKPSSNEPLLGSLEVTPHVKDLSSPPIHQFVPTLAPSEFYAKLKAIVQNASTSKFTKNSELISPPEIPAPPESSET